MLSTYDYTICSTDPEHYNRVYTNLGAQASRESRFIVTSLTTNCNIIVLSSDDYFTLNSVQYYFTDDYTTMDVDTLVGLMNALVADSTSFTFAYDTCSRVNVTSSETTEFELTDASYNVKLLLGITNTTLPLISNDLTIQLTDVGAFLSTPVLYLTSNIGYNSYKNLTDTGYLTSMKIVMRINNSYSSSYPIFATNGDFNVTVPSADLSNAQFILTDANYVEVKLLNPLYITITVEPIKDAVEAALNSGTEGQK